MLNATALAAMHGQAGVGAAACALAAPLILILTGTQTLALTLCIHLRLVTEPQGGEVAAHLGGGAGRACEAAAVVLHWQHQHVAPVDGALVGC